MADTPVLDEQRLNDLGVTLFKQFGVHESDRKMIEQRWLKNLRQVRKIYDPEVLKMIPDNCSKAYPGVTQWMVRGTIARLMQMLFPQTERNWGVKASPLPDLSTAQLQEVLDGLVAAKGGDPAKVALTDVEIEKAIAEFAKGKAERMALKIEDDLAEMDYVTLIRKVVRSAVIYNIGVLKGPLHEKVKARKWQQNQYTGKWEAVEVEKYKPLFEFLPVWDYYPDLTAVSLDKQDGAFERHILTRAQVEELGERPDFLTERVNKYLNEHATGNYRARDWEATIKGEPKSDQATVAAKESRKFEAAAYWGGISGHDLFAAGVPIAQDDLGKTHHANVWLLDNVVIKAKLAPFGDAIRHHHEFVFEDDDLSILGNGQCDTLRDSQASICEVARAALDNASVIGPMAVVNDDYLTPGQSLGIAKHKTWRVEGMSGNQSLTSAVGNLSIDSHLPDLTALLRVFMEFADKESGLPPASLGDTSGGGSEALRTSKNASMFLGAAALPIRDTVRNFDTFTVSVIGALVKWNMRYDPNPSRDGDHTTIARGSTSLIAKEVLSQSLDEFRSTVSPDEAPHLKTRGLLIERIKARDLPIDSLLEDEDKANEIIAAQQQAQQSQLAGQEALIKAQAEKAVADALAAAAKARATDASIGIDVFAQIIEGLKVGDKGAMDRAQSLIAAHSADTARMQAEKPEPARAAA